jgi:hypothetical protein
MPRGEREGQSLISTLDRLIFGLPAGQQRGSEAPTCKCGDRSPHAGVAAADFPLVAVGVLEEDGVVAGRVFVAILRALDVLRAGLADDRPEPVDFFFRVRPEGEAGGVAAVAGFLVEVDEGALLRSPSAE